MLVQACNNIVSKMVAFLAGQLSAILQKLQCITFHVEGVAVIAAKTTVKQRHFHLHFS